LTGHCTWVATETRSQILFRGCSPPNWEGKRRR